MRKIIDNKLYVMMDVLTSLGDSYGGGAGGDVYSASSNLDTFATSVEKNATTARSIIQRLYNVVDGMPVKGSWSGSVYLEFKSSCDSYKNKLNEYPDLLDEIANEIKSISSETERTCDSINGRCSNNLGAASQSSMGNRRVGQGPKISIGD